MLYEWQAAANALRKGKITQEAYDQWRYNFPDGDTTRRWVKVPSQGLMDELVAGLPLSFLYQRDKEAVLLWTAGIIPLEFL